MDYINLNYFDPYIMATRLIAVLLFVSIDIIASFVNPDETTSYSGHFFGGVAGLMFGLAFLENKRIEQWETYIQKIALAIFGLLLAICAIWHVAGSYTCFFPIIYTYKNITCTPDASCA
jgi:hypothetical protein